MQNARQRRGVLLAIVLVALAGCGGDGGGSPTAVQNDGAEGGNQTTQCHAGNQVIVTVVFAASGGSFYGVHTRLSYPATLSIPGHRDDQPVVDRVRFMLDLPLGRYDVPEETFVNGITTLNDEDTDADGIDDRLQALLSSRTSFDAGRFIDVTFDCAETIDWPTADLFGCELAGLTDLNFMDADTRGGCHVVIAPPASPSSVGVARR